MEEAIEWTAGAAIAAAFFAGCFLMSAIGRSGLSRAASASAAAGANGGLLAWRMRNGIPPLLPLTRLLLRFPIVGSFARDAMWVFEQRGLKSAPEAAVSLFLTALVVIGVAGGVLSSSWLCGTVLSLTGSVLVLLALKAQRDKREQQMKGAAPDALGSLCMCFQSGLSLLQALQQVAGETDGPLGKLFSRAAHRLEVGGSVESALAVFQERGSSVNELAFVAVALDVQHRVGGSVSQVLLAAKETLEGEAEVRRSLRVKTAQAKLSAQVVTAMPFMLVSLFSLLSPDFLTPFFSSAYGIALLCLAVGMQAAGIVLVRKMLAVEVEL